jgi:hypothetical protein
MNDQPRELRPWYKEPWPWVAIAVPGAAVVMGVITLYLALTNPDYLVVDEEQYREIKSELHAEPVSAAGQDVDAAARGPQDGDH